MSDSIHISDYLSKMGQAENTRTRTARRQILECLAIHSSDFWMQIGALRGLSYLDDEKALESLYLVKALIPDCEELRQYLIKRYEEKRAKP